MAYFRDLTPHTYTPTGGEPVLNVGWLDAAEAFPAGPTSAEFHAALRRLCTRPILKHRGFHTCQFCRGKAAADDGRHGTGQIRVRGRDGVWYAAPTMIRHYVTGHRYFPPAAFVAAVLDPAAVAAD